MLLEVVNFLAAAACVYWCSRPLRGGLLRMWVGWSIDLSELLQLLGRYPALLEAHQLVLWLNSRLG